MIFSSPLSVFQHTKKEFGTDNVLLNMSKATEIIEYTNVQSPFIQRRMFIGMIIGFSLLLEEYAKQEKDGVIKDNRGTYNFDLFQDRLGMEMTEMEIREHLNGLQKCEYISYFIKGENILYNILPRALDSELYMDDK